MAMRLRGSSALVSLGVALLLAAFSPAPAQEAPQEAPAMGLMTSLPLYWPEGASLADIAAGTAVPPWQRRAIETAYRIVPLDTLSPIAGLTPDTPETDPLAELARLAVIQPRGLSPVDNVALDEWVSNGGRLLLVLDPALTGEYAAPLGDPRRPVDAALIPPVVERWGLAIGLPPADADSDAGTIDLLPEGAKACTLSGDAISRCRIGKGEVTLIVDAALFEHAELAGEGGEAIARLLDSAFDQ